MIVVYRAEKGPRTLCLADMEQGAEVLVRLLAASPTVSRVAWRDIEGRDKMWERPED